MSVLANLPLPLSVHAWNSDLTEVAVTQNDNKVYILRKQGNSFSTVHTLAEHDKLVTGIDWGHQTNRIVTCSQDRNAYVWNFDNATKTWKPTLVLLRINRAATCVKWSPNEDKFAVATGARLIAVCYFDEENNWWVSKHIKKPIRSTVLSLDWHPMNVLLVSGTSDMKSRVFSAFIKGVDKKAGDPVWGDKLPIGTVCGEFGGEFGGWIHGVAFSPSGNAIAWVGHDSTIGVASPSQNYITTIKVASLPLTSLIFLNETQIVAAGYDAVPYLFEQRADGWHFVRKLDEGSKKSGAVDSAMNKFRQMDSKGQEKDDSALDSIHQNTITNIEKYEVVNGNVTKFTTSGQDGMLVLWDVLALGIKRMGL